MVPHSSLQNSFVAVTKVFGVTKNHYDLDPNTAALISWFSPVSVPAILIALFFSTVKIYLKNGLLRSVFRLCWIISIVWVVQICMKDSQFALSAFFNLIKLFN